MIEDLKTNGDGILIPELTTTDLEALLDARNFNALREHTKNWSAPDLADFMEPMPVEKEAIIFRLLPRQQAAVIFSYLSSERQEELLKAMANEEVASILNAMS